jgi:hypothetical protein
VLGVCNCFISTLRPPKVLASVMFVYVRDGSFTFLSSNRTPPQVVDRGTLHVRVVPIKSRGEQKRETRSECGMHIKAETSKVSIKVLEMLY